MSVLGSKHSFGWRCSPVLLTSSFQRMDAEETGCTNSPTSQDASDELIIGTASPSPRLRASPAESPTPESPRPSRIRRSERSWRQSTSSTRPLRQRKRHTSFVDGAAVDFPISRSGSGSNGGDGSMDGCCARNVFLLGRLVAASRRPDSTHDFRKRLAEWAGGIPLVALLTPATRNCEATEDDHTSVARGAADDLVGGSSPAAMSVVLALQEARLEVSYGTRSAHGWLPADGLVPLPKCFGLQDDASLAAQVDAVVRELANLQREVDEAETAKIDQCRERVAAAAPDDAAAELCVVEEIVEPAPQKPRPKKAAQKSTLAVNLFALMIDDPVRLAADRQ